SRRENAGLTNRNRFVAAMPAKIAIIFKVRYLPGKHVCRCGRYKGDVAACVYEGKCGGVGFISSQAVRCRQVTVMETNENKAPAPDGRRDIGGASRPVFVQRPRAMVELRCQSHE